MEPPPPAEQARSWPVAEDLPPVVGGDIFVPLAQLLLVSTYTPEADDVTFGDLPPSNGHAHGKGVRFQL